MGRLPREKYVDPRISFSWLPQEEMRSFPYDSKELNQVLQGLSENPTGSDKSNEHPFSVFTDEFNSTLNRAMAASISKSEYEVV